MIEPLCALLQLRRCSLSVPNLRWLFSEDPRPAAVSYVNLAGGVARALLNIAAGSTAGLIAVRASSAPSQLRLLSRHAATTPQVSHVVRAALSLLDAAVAPGAGGRPAAAAASTAVVGPPHPLVDACTDAGVTVPGCGVAGRATLASIRQQSAQGRRRRRGAREVRYLHGRKRRAARRAEPQQRAIRRLPPCRLPEKERRIPHALRPLARKVPALGGRAERPSATRRRGIAARFVVVVEGLARPPATARVENPRPRGVERRVRCAPLERRHRARVVDVLRWLPRQVAVAWVDPLH